MEIFLLSFCFSFLAWEHSLYDFNYFKFRGLFYGSDYSLCWYMFYEFWNRLYILQWVGGVLSMCWLDTVGWWCWWYILVDFLYSCSEMVLKYSTTIASLPIPTFFQFYRFFFTYFVTVLFGAYTFIITLFSWQIDTYIIHNSSSLSSVIFFGPKFILSDVYTTTPALFSSFFFTPYK